MTLKHVGGVADSAHEQANRAAPSGVDKPSSAFQTWRGGLARLVIQFLVPVLLIVAVAGAVFALDPSLLSGQYDGEFTYVNVAQRLQWQPSDDPFFGMYYPLEGMGSRLIPIVIVLLPHLSAFYLTDEPGTRIWLVYVILAGLLAAGTLVYYRAAGVKPRIAVPSTCLQIVLAMTLSDLARATWQVVWGQAGMLIALALFLHIGRGRRGRTLTLSAAFVVFMVLFLLSDHNNAGFLAGPVLAAAVLVHLIGAGSRRERLWKIATLMMTACVVVVVGIPQWALTLVAGTSRAVFFEEIIPQAQYWYNAGMPFRANDAFTLVYVLALLGMAGELTVRRQAGRTLAWLTVLLLGGVTLAGLVWSTTDIRWRLPAPAYFNVYCFPWLALAAVCGLDHLWSWRAEASQDAWSARYRAVLVAVASVGVFVGLKLWFGSATLFVTGLIVLLLAVVLAIRVLVGSRTAAATVVFVVGILAVALNGDTLSYRRLWTGQWGGPNSIQVMAQAEPPFDSLLMEQIRLTPGSTFRGYVDSIPVAKRTLTIVEPEILRWHSRSIPTLSQYTLYLSPAYHLFITRLLMKPEDRPNIAHLTMTRVDTRLMGMLGLRYLMSAAPLDQPDLTPIAIHPDAALGDRTLYELRDPNLASYSPVQLRRVADAGAVIQTLAQPSLDPRVEAVVTEDVSLGWDLVGATDTRLTFVPGGFRFAAKSSGTSLVVLPVQFTRCLILHVEQGAPDSVRAVRVNLIQTGIVLSGDVEVSGRIRFSGPWERCIQDDLADVDQLGIRNLVERRRLPEQSHPGPRLRLFGPLGLD